MKVEHLREFVTDQEIHNCQEAIPRGKTKDFYLGFKTAIALISPLIKVFDRREISVKLAAIVINLEKELNK